MLDGVISRGSGSCEGKSAMSSKRSFSVVLEEALLNKSGIILHNRSTRVLVIANCCIKLCISGRFKRLGMDVRVAVLGSITEWGGGRRVGFVGRMHWSWLKGFIARREVFVP